MFGGFNPVDTRLQGDTYLALEPTVALETQNLEGWERHIFATCNTATDDYTTNLAAPQYWAGQTLVFRASVANSKTITLGVQGGDPVQWTDLVFDTDDDEATLYSDGERIVVVNNGIA